MSKARIPELDGIRGLAVTLVIIWHFVTNGIEARPATFLSYLQASGRLAWTGVDLFFVLSGFLIGGILLDSRNSPDYFQRFYKRRFFRIIPIYLAMVVIYLMTVGFYGNVPIASYFLFLQNFWMAKRDTLGFFAATWSLAVEEQFYLVMPSVIRFVARPIPVFLVGIIFAPILRILLLHFLRQPELTASYALMPCRADALLLGVLGAWLIRNKKDWLKAEVLEITLIGFLVGAGYLTIHNDLAFTLTYGMTWIALLYLNLILFVVTHQGWLAAIFRIRWLRELGTISYGVYLVHQLMLSAVHRAVDGKWTFQARLINFHGVAVVVVAVVLTIIVCELSWKYFESPLLTFTRPSLSSDYRHPQP